MQEKKKRPVLAGKNRASQLGGFPCEFTAAKYGKGTITRVARSFPALPKSSSTKDVHHGRGTRACTLRRDDTLLDTPGNATDTHITREERTFRDSSVESRGSRGEREPAKLWPPLPPPPLIPGAGGCKDKEAKKAADGGGDKRETVGETARETLDLERTRKREKKDRTTGEGKEGSVAVEAARETERKLAKGQGKAERASVLSVCAKATGTKERTARKK